MINFDALLDDLKKNLDVETGDKTRRQNSVDAVNAFLRKLLNKDSLSNIDDIMSNSRSQQAKREAMPTYNVRTPVVHIWINGVKVFPFNDNPDSESKYSGIYFDGFDLNYPIGGIETTVTGTLKLFSRDPGLVIDAVEGRQYYKSFNANNTANLPLVTLQWGWRFGQRDGEHDTKQVLSPAINFIVTEIIMENPDANGTNFTFRLQDIGNCVLGMSRKAVAVDSAFPQDQIKYIIEGLLNFRLFTLDDLLNLAGRSGYDINAKDKENDPVNKEANTFFVNEKLGILKTNSHNYLTICERLAYQCKCRWSSVKYEKLKESINAASSSRAKYDELRLQLEQVKNEKVETGKEEEHKAKLLKIETELNEAKENLAYSCKLYWVENIPPQYQTLTSNKYIKDENTKKENGAFFLLPDLEQTDGDFNPPLCFGPGATAFPYLHGSAQNVFNSSIREDQSGSQTFGDVISITTKYDSMIPLLEASTHENAMSLTDTDYMNIEKRKMSVAQVMHEKKNLQSDIETKDKPFDTELTDKVNAEISENLNLYKTGVRVHTRTNFRFYNPTSPTGVIIGDAKPGENLSSLSSVSLKPQDKQYYNTSDTEIFAEMNLRNRTNFFLKYPVSINMSVFGDPTLLRMGVGGFELLSYYPSESGKTQKLNVFLSGVYFPQTIVHRMSMGSYTCEISGIKVTTTNKYSLTSEIISKTVEEEIYAKDKEDKTMSTKLQTQAITPQLDSEEFLKGFLSKSLQELYNRTKPK